MVYKIDNIGIAHALGVKQLDAIFQLLTDGLMLKNYDRIKTRLPVSWDLDALLAILGFDGLKRKAIALIVGNYSAPF